MFVFLFKKILGVLCVIAGIFFGFVPVVPGFVLIFIGLELLGVPIVPWETLKSYFKRKKEDETGTPEESVDEHKNTL